MLAGIGESGHSFRVGCGSCGVDLGTSGIAEGIVNVGRVVGGLTIGVASGAASFELVFAY